MIMDRKGYVFGYGAAPVAIAEVAPALDARGNGRGMVHGWDRVISALGKIDGSGDPRPELPVWQYLPSTLQAEPQQASIFFSTSRLLLVHLCSACIKRHVTRPVNALYHGGVPPGMSHKNAHHDDEAARRIDVGISMHGSMRAHCPALPFANHSRPPSTKRMQSHLHALLYSTLAL